MARTKYKYNPETLAYEEVELSIKDKLLKISYFAITGVVVGVIAVFAFASWIQTWNDDDMAAKYANLKKELEDIKEIVYFDNTVLAHLQETDDKIYRSIYEAEPIPSYKRNFGTGGNPKKYDQYKGYDHSDLVIEIRSKLEEVEKKMVVQSESYDELKELVKTKKEMLACIPSIQPISNKDLTRLASGFGFRMHPIHKIQKMHTGIDFTADSGTDIYATGNAVIERADRMSGYGQVVIIDHGFGHKSLYAHCSAYKCKVGQKVRKGDVIALVGSTGVSTGPHVHYEVRKRMKGENGRMTYKPVNPVNYFFNDLSPEEYERVIEISSRPTQSM
ncbi:MAG: M23 family metallopeptidase [Flavobacteriales bacterium]|nr:M23 family metallopeptidase [Flavobacteriales bacterium]